MREFRVDRWSHPVGFWLYVGAVTLALAALAWVMLEMTSPGLPRFMLAGVLLIVASVAYSPSTLDLTGWTVAVMAMCPTGLILLIGSPIIYALWVAFVGPHLEVTIK